MTRVFVRRKWLTDFHLINMKLAWNLFYSSSHGGDELLDEEFILVLFLLLHLCIMCMWYKRDLNAFFVSFSLPRGACKLNVRCMPESLWLWWLSIHKNMSDVSQKLFVSWCCFLNKTSWRFFPCTWKECLSFCLYLMLRFSLKWSLCIMIEYPHSQLGEYAEANSCKQ